MNDDKQNETPPPPEDQLATLIRLAEGKPALPAHRLERARTAVHAHWRRQVRERRGRRALRFGTWLAAAALLVAAAGLAVRNWGPSEDPMAGRVVAVTLHTDGAPVQVGQKIPAGFDLDTGEGRVALLLDGRTSVRLDRDTRVRVLSPTSVALDRGRLYVDSGPTAGSMEIHTDAGLIRDIGTQFEVRAREGAVRVRVREGKVILNTEEQSHEIGAGGQLEVDAAGAVTRGEIATHGELWDWVTAIAPMLELEGLSAHEFLDWAARESGWELRFADQDLERSAESIVLSGSTEGLTIQQALDAVLPTCRMAHQVHEGVLLVRRLAPSG